MLKHRDSLSPGVRRVHKRIQKACKDAPVGEVLEALLLEYSECLLAACSDFGMHQRNVARANDALEANARHYFRRQN
jgi:hypothetical protein